MRTYSLFGNNLSLEISQLIWNLFLLEGITKETFIEYSQLDGLFH